MKPTNMAPVLVALSLALAACNKDADYILQDTSPTAAIPAGDEPDTTKFRWVLSKDLSTRNSYVRTFGVGYSYDAVKGRFCNWEDIRCQVVSRTELRSFEKENSVVYYHAFQSEYASTSSRFDYSLRDYMANITLESKTEVNLGLYNGEKRTKQYVIENGIQQQIYYTRTDYRQLGRQYIEYDNILSEVKYGEFQLLTNSFVNAVFHIAETKKDNFAVVDSFINVYGTHVITDASLGGSLSVEIQNDMWRYSDEVSEEQWSEDEFLLAISNKNEARKNSALFTLIENCRIDISATGGDQSAISQILGTAKYDGTRNIDLDAVSRWNKSLVYDPADEAASNVELINMQVTPIWRFIEPLDEEVADRVKAAILQDAALQQELLGDRNFFSTSFKAQFPSASCQYRYKTNGWKTYSVNNPDIVNIVSNGKYVATVCREKIDGKDFVVAYPIYEGVINLACGLGVSSDGRAYRVRMINGNTYLLELRPEEMPQTSTFYVNAGALSFLKRDDITYAPSTAYPYIELSGGVLPDGGYESTAYPVTKSGEDFLCPAPSSLAKPLVSWTYNNSSKSWKRNANYVYIFNPNELK